METLIAHNAEVGALSQTLLIKMQPLLVDTAQVVQAPYLLNQAIAHSAQGAASTAGHMRQRSP